VVVLLLVFFGWKRFMKVIVNLNDNYSMSRKRAFADGPDRNASDGKLIDLYSKYFYC